MKKENKVHKFFKNPIVNGIVYIFLGGIILLTVFSYFDDRRKYIVCQNAGEFPVYFSWNNLYFNSMWDVSQQRFITSYDLIGEYEDEVTAGPGEKDWEKHNVIVDRINATVTFVSTTKKYKGIPLKWAYNNCEKISKRKLPKPAKAKF